MAQELTLSEFSTAQRWRSLIAVIGSVFGVGVSFGALVPLMSLTLERHGVDSTGIGLNSSMFPLAVILVAPPLLLGLGLAPPVFAHQSTLRMLRSALIVMVAAYAGGFTDSGVFVLLPIYGLRTGFDVPSSILLLAVFTAGNLLLQIPIGLIA